MGSDSIYPRSNKESVKLLLALGFKKKWGVGRGKHPERYEHPTRQNTNPDDKPFVIITHDYFDVKAKHMMKKLQNWGFSKEEIEAALKGKKLKEPKVAPLQVDPEEV